MKSKILCLLLLLSFSVAGFSQKKVAILPVVDKQNAFTGGQKLMVRGILTDVITDLDGYEGYDRVNLASIMDEQKFQRSGYVSDAEIKRIGVMTGCQYVLVVTMDKFDAQNTIFNGQILDAESAKIEQSGTADGLNNIDGYKKACEKLVRRLLKVSIGNNGIDINDSYGSSGGKRSFTVRGVTFNMVPVEGGTFNMGATYEQGSDYDNDERPVHQVTLSNYLIGETEVTQELWQAVMGLNPSRFSGSRRPVEQVSWNDCQEFISRLNQLTGQRFRLPTEAEWKFAARGGRKSQMYKYSGSNNIFEVAWHTDNSGGQTHEVGTKKANELGIYDMSGNVYEWCSDWYGSYSSSSQTNPTGAYSGSYRVYRGGSWWNSAGYCRVSFRFSSAPGSGGDNLGLRLTL